LTDCIQVIGNDDERAVGFGAVRMAVRNERERVGAPERLIKGFGTGRVRNEKGDGFAALPGGRGQPDSLGEAIRLVVVTIYLSQSALPARAIRKRVSRGTGRPVAPLSLPWIQAVPARSRCAQGYALVKRDRKQAAVIVPPQRPPIFAMSANGLFSRS